jgi:methionyl-tRNA synthetase
MSDQAIVSRINVELANDLGNLSQRSLALIARNCGGVLPARGTGTGAGAAAFSEDDAGMDAAAAALPGLVRDHLERQDFHVALEEVWKVIRGANGYIDRQAPWALNRTDKARMGTVLRVLVDTLRAVATVLQPFMPDSMSRMLDQLGVAADQRQLAALAVPLPDGITLPAPHGVFPRYVEPAA